MHFVQRSPTPSVTSAADCHAFDAIIIRGRRFIHVPLEIRCELLSDVTAELKSHTPLTRFDTTPAELIALAKEFGFEVSAHGGVMAYTQSLQRLSSLCFIT